MAIELRGAVVVLTGASKGLGVVIARRLAAEGAKLALAARSKPELDSVVAELTAAGATAIAVPTDVRDEAALAALLERTEAELGPIDVLINNAGLEIVEFFEDSTRDEVTRLLDVNLTAPIRLCQLVLPGMKARGRGQIVNIASMSSLFPDPFGAVYSASKHGLLGVTKALRQELMAQGLDIGVNAVCPGFVEDTGMVTHRAETENMPRPPSIVGMTSSEAVATAVVKSITHNPPRIIVSPGLPSLNMAIGALFPRFLDWLQIKLGVHRPRMEASLFRRRQRERP